MGVEKFGRTSIHKHSNPERKVSMNYQKHTDRFVSSDGKTAVSYYTYIPQNQYYHITITQRRKLFEMIRYA